MVAMAVYEMKKNAQEFIEALVKNPLRASL
jgi:hypothetical protein